METNVTENIVKAHQELIDKVQLQVEMLSEGAATSHEESVKFKQSLLEKYKHRLAEIIEAKEQAIRQFDEEINRRKALIESLDKTITEAKRAIADGEPSKPVTAQPAQPANEPEAAAAGPEKSAKDAEQAEPSAKVKKAKSVKRSKAASEKKSKRARGSGKVSKQAERK